MRFSVRRKFVGEITDYHNAHDPHGSDDQNPDPEIFGDEGAESSEYTDQRERPYACQWSAHPLSLEPYQETKCQRNEELMEWMNTLIHAVNLFCRRNNLLTSRMLTGMSPKANIDPHSFRESDPIWKRDCVNGM